MVKKICLSFPFLLALLLVAVLQGCGLFRTKIPNGVILGQVPEDKSIMIDNVSQLTSGRAGGLKL